MSSSSSNHLTGRAFITAGGKRLASKPGAKMNMGNLERKGEAGDAGVLGYTEAVTIPFVECTIAHSAQTSLQEYANMVDVTVSFDTDTGKSYVFRNAWQASVIELAGKDVALRFEAISCEEV